MKFDSHNLEKNESNCLSNAKFIDAFRSIEASTDGSWIALTFGQTKYKL
jgi:hypothetical protein